LVAQEIAQHERAVVLEVAGAVQERHRPPAARREQRLAGRAICGQLLAVALAKLLPALDPMPVPAAQRRTRCHVLQPGHAFERLLAHAAGPQALDQEALAIAALARVVDPLDLDHPASSSISCPSTWGRMPPAS